MTTSIPQVNAGSAWIATGMSSSTFPTTCCPLLVVSPRKRFSTPDTIGPSDLRSRTPSFRLRALVWVMAVIAQTVQILVAAITATETKCEGKVPITGRWMRMFTPLKNRLSRALTMLEVLLGRTHLSNRYPCPLANVVPFFPHAFTRFVASSSSLDPLRQGRFWAGISKMLVAWMVVVTAALLLSASGGLLLVTVTSSKLMFPGSMPANIALVEGYKNWNQQTSTSGSSLWLCMALDRSTSPFASFPGSSAVTAHLPCPWRPHLRFLAQRARLHTDSTLFRRRLIPRECDKAMSVSRYRLAACFRRLRVFLWLILGILAWNLFMVFRRPFPDVLHTVTGWVSC
ncbi:hypothetical protein BCR44DRAFT_95494 [Catenaria anguillulae PL171]|uniref:Uncharacterized protein n=1 Tax=Catenaria anguillulae PL171 TaxID=765915 RepID=A0A1Y2H875_9FUNG|nr:hypothetical protein BCR44DRAFT_95494 [Catenaria anguillulae PL171]